MSDSLTVTPLKESSKPKSADDLLSLAKQKLAEA
jgi:hypothetical protein